MPRPTRPKRPGPSATWRGCRYRWQIVQLPSRPPSLPLRDLHPPARSVGRSGVGRRASRAWPRPPFPTAARLPGDKSSSDGLVGDQRRLAQSVRHIQATPRSAIPWPGSFPLRSVLYPGRIGRDRQLRPSLAGLSRPAFCQKPAPSLPFRGNPERPVTAGPASRRTAKTTT